MLKSFTNLEEVIYFVELFYVKKKEYVIITIKLYILHITEIIGLCQHWTDMIPIC